MAENMGDKSVYIRAFWPREISQSTSLRSIQSNGGIYSKSTRLGRLARLNPPKSRGRPGPFGTLDQGKPLLPPPSIPIL